MNAKLPKNDVVLLGLGHTNAHVLRMWRMKPIPDARLTCISDFPIVTYSGMLPGTLAGQYGPDRMVIDLVRLCAAAGARLIVDEVVGMDRDNQRLLFRERPPLQFDVLSVGIGSIPRMDQVVVEGDALVPIKPMQTFLARLQEKLIRIPRKESLHAAVVGGGAGGVEIAFCLPHFLRAVRNNTPLEMTLIDAGDRLVTGMTDGSARKVQQQLEALQVRVRLGKRVTNVRDGEVVLDGGERIAADLVLWATGAAAPPLLARLGLPVDDKGFLLIRPSLQTVAEAPIFAVGDSGTIAETPHAKAGVYAVRQGPFLWENIQRTLKVKPLHRYVPQKGFLKLLNTGDGRAIAEYLGLTFHGKWCWRLKDSIDSKFMRMYQEYTPMPRRPEMPDALEQMRCAGCGGKVAGSVLSRVLSQLSIPTSEHVLLGLDRPDDAAIVRVPGGRPVTATVDFFSAPLDDPYVVGRIAALNALSDVFAMGAKPLAALAIATLPVGRPRQQEQLLHELLAGGLHEFQRTGTALVGGHTIEGPQLTVGYTILADQGVRPPRTKGNLRAGDALILTKPLGSGILLAAHMQAQCRADWMDVLLKTMLHSNALAASLAEEFDTSALTDITGFGLAGHLLEMLKASGVGAELEVDAIPLLPGVQELVQEHGIESTLAPANREAETEIDAAAAVQATASYAALFDPQTCGGLLLGVTEVAVEPMLKRLRGQSAITCARIGRVTGPKKDQRKLVIRRK